MANFYQAVSLPPPGPEGERDGGRGEGRVAAEDQVDQLLRLRDLRVPDQHGPGHKARRTPHRCR